MLASIHVLISHSLPLWDSPLLSPPPARLVIYLFIPEVEADRGRGRRKGVTVDLIWSGNIGNRGKQHRSPGRAAAAEGMGGEE